MTTLRTLAADYNVEIPEIAATLDLAADQAARLAALATRAAAARADLRAAVILARHTGVTEREISRATGLSRSTVRAWLAQYGSGGATGGGGSPRSI